MLLGGYTVKQWRMLHKPGIYVTLDLVYEASILSDGVNMCDFMVNSFLI